MRDGPARHGGQSVDLLGHLRAQRERFVIKPNDEYGGTGVTLGWETVEREWDAGDRASRSGARRRLGRAGTDRDPARDLSRSATADTVDERDMLVDFAPYLFRGSWRGFSRA